MKLNRATKRNAAKVFAKEKGLKLKEAWAVVKKQTNRKSK